MFTLPDYRELDDTDLRRTIADLQFQRDVAEAFLRRALDEQTQRRRDRKEGAIRIPRTKAN